MTEETWVQAAICCAGLEDELVAVVFQAPRSPLANNQIAHILYCGQCGLNLTNNAIAAWDHFEFAGNSILLPVRSALSRAITYPSPGLDALARLSEQSYLGNWREILETPHNPHNL